MFIHTDTVVFQLVIQTNNPEDNKKKKFMSIILTFSYIKPQVSLARNIFLNLCNFCRYLKEVKVTYQTPDKRDPEFVFYDVTRAVVNVYR